MRYGCRDEQASGDDEHDGHEQAAGGQHDVVHVAGLGVDFAEPVGVGSRSRMGAVMAIAFQKAVKSGI